jgi:hypothetical protein
LARGEHCYFLSPKPTTEIVPREVDLPPFLTQTVKTQNPSNGELSHGVVT